MLNSSDLTLLPGDASVFMDDNFVSKSRIEVSLIVLPLGSFVVKIAIHLACRTKRLV